MDHERYKRQTSLAWLGEAGQKKLLNSHIAVIGAGGLGCPLLLYLGAMGVGKITLVDNDIVSRSNLHRQILFSADDIGKPKAQIAADKIMVSYPDTKIIPIIQRLDTELAKKICSDVDLVIDGTDSFLSKYILSDYADILLTASVTNMQGYIGGFTQECSYPALFPNPPLNAQNCNDNGVLGSVAGIMGTMLATEAVKILCNHPKNILNSLLKCDFDRLYFSLNKISSNKDKIYHKFPEIIYVKTLENADEIIVDVREPHEIKDIKLTKNYRSYPLSTLNLEDILEIEKPIFRCQSGRRAENVALQFGLKKMSNTPIKLFF